MTDLKELKQNVLMTAKKAHDEKLMAGTSGNISAYFREKQWIVITPSSYDYSLMAEEDIVVIDLDGNLVEGRHKPSSEWKMHAEIYRHLSHANAVVHTHSPYASSFAVNHQEIPVVLIEMIPFLKGKLEVSPYAQQGTDAHKLCEYKVLKALGKSGRDPTADLDYYDAEMENCTEEYCNFVIEQFEEAKKLCKDPLVLVEQRLDFSRWVPDGFRTRV